ICKSMIVNEDTPNSKNISSSPISFIGPFCLNRRMIVSRIFSSTMNTPFSTRPLHQQCLIQLSIRRNRQHVAQYDAGRNHVVRQNLAQLPSDIRRLESTSLPPLYVGYQQLIANLLFA